MDDEEVMERPQLAHEPNRPPRADIYGEVIFAEHWKRLMAQPCDWREEEEGGLLGSILRYLPLPISQRDATVAASFICWLGTNCGRCFLSQAKARAGEAADKHERSLAYLCQWAVENRRIGYINHGFRAIEFWMMDAEESAEVNKAVSAIFWRRPKVEVSGRDLEVADAIAMWLGADEGQAFIKAAELEIELTAQAIREHQDAEWRAQRRARALQPPAAE